MSDDPLKATADPAWVIYVDGHDPIREPSIESRFAISNGFLGIRGGRAATRGVRWVVPARTYVAGLFDSPDGVPGLVPAADWLKLSIILPDGPLVHHPGDISAHRMTLDMRRGALLSEARYVKAPDLTAAARTLRLVSRHEPALGLQLIQFQIESGTIDIALEISFEGMELGLVSERLEQDLGVWRTQHTGKQVAIATAASLQIDGDELSSTPLGQMKWCWRWTTRPGQVVDFQRMVAIIRADTQSSDPATTARDKLGVARHVGWRAVLAAHEQAWASRWQCSEVDITGDTAARQALHFAIYHLNSAANPADERVSIGARALTGDNYRGHVFWDTEIFLLPFYTFTWPEAARSLLMYRFHTLGGARAKAAGMGWRGAMYAWESADTGAEVTPETVVGPDRHVIPILCGTQEQHISADVAYAVWQYWQATGDETFLHDAGAEIILETARFWASRAQPEADGKCHIRGVIGPDEYHETIDDSAYTNVMARWNIRKGLDIVALLQKRWPAHWIRLSGQLGLNTAEIEQWHSVAETIAIPLDAETGLYEEFTGYFDLEDIDLAAYSGRSVPIDVILGRERTQKSRVVKQADIVALLALLPEVFVTNIGAANFDYYEPRCAHGSSLSPAMHGLVAARLGRSELALRYFRQSAAIDLSDTRVGIDGGIHIAALGGNWMLAVLGFAGLSLQADCIALDPQLPAAWRKLAFQVQWHGRYLNIEIDQDAMRLRARLEAGDPMQVCVSGDRFNLSRDKPLNVITRPPSQI